MDMDLKYLLSKVNSIDHPKWEDTKDAIIWILSSFINKSLIEKLVSKRIESLKIKLKYIKKYTNYDKELTYIQKLIDNYNNKLISTLEELISISKEIDTLELKINSLYIRTLENNDVLYFDDNLDEYIEVLDLEKTSKVPVIDVNDKDIEIISDLEKTMKLAKLSKEQLKKLDINDKTIEVLKDLEKTMVLKPINDIEVLDLEKTIKMPKVKKELKKLDINDDSIEIISDLEKTLFLNKKLEEDNIEILDYLDKTIKIPKLTKKELKKLDINDETIEVLDFLDKTRKIPKIKSTELTSKEIKSLKNLEATVKINRYKITESILKELARRKKIRKIAFTSILTVLCITFFISSYRIIAWYRSNASLREEIEEITKNIEIKEIDDDNNIVANENDKYLNETFIDVDFDELKNTNPDTIGWIYVPGTNINYPFVQTNDNKYYLEHSFTKNYNEAGWVFMDYRNKVDVLDYNTIIYAHGRLDKTMFGSLRNALEEEWYQNPDNHYIKISMPSNNTLWQVFSVYKIDTETYYLRNNFDSYESHKSFIDNLKRRSIYDFDVNVTTGDKILTLSTCYDNFKKVVVHAKMIKQYNK